MEYLFISFIAGILTVFAPCVFTLLPVILGGSLSASNWKRATVIIVSLCVSIFIFTLTLKASTLLINIDPSFWNYLAGFILIAFGVVTLFPNLWDGINNKLGLSKQSDELLSSGAQRSGFWGNVAIGAALGPVFSSCSPTYAIIIATILPVDLTTGLINLLAYVLGLALILILIGIFGQQIIKRFKWAANPRGNFKRFLGVVFILLGIMIFFGVDKQLQTFLLDNGFLDVTRIESQLLKDIK